MSSSRAWGGVVRRNRASNVAQAIVVAQAFRPARGRRSSPSQPPPSLRWSAVAHVKAEGLRYVCAVLLFVHPATANAQPTVPAQTTPTVPAPVVRVTFAEAIKRAQDRNPTVTEAATGILRAEALIRQSRAATLLQVTGSVTTTTLNRGVEFSGTTVTPRNSLTAGLSADMPIL